MDDTLRFFFKDTATTETYTLSLHDALPICRGARPQLARSPAELPREDADDGRHHDERHQDEADIRPRVAAVAEGRADADGAGGGAPRKAEDEDGGREGAAHGHMR